MQCYCWNSYIFALILGCRKDIQTKKIGESAKCLRERTSVFRKKGIDNLLLERKKLKTAITRWEVVKISCCLLLKIIGPDSGTLLPRLKGISFVLI